MNNYFRPKARHIFTIGKDLIKDDFSALIEIIKNSYDADASSVSLDFCENDEAGLYILIKDDGIGMSENDIMTKWLVPSNDNKKKEKYSPTKHRVYQGQKGVGRYAVSILGDRLVLITIKDKIRTTLDINWNDFNDSDKFLDEIKLNISTEKTNENDGTAIHIYGDNSKQLLWNDANRYEKLIKELRKLKPPFIEKDDFMIMGNYFGKKFNISENTLEEFYDYKITGEILVDGTINFIYINADKKGDIETGSIFSKVSHIPGTIKFHFLVTDQDIGKRREEIARSFGRHEDRSIKISEFKNISGISIYRGDFRIRPYGESNEDWLDLNKERFNNPTFRISSNQIYGYVVVQGDDESHLIEASSRERLKENEYFDGLKKVISEVIALLEERRFNHRTDIGIREKTKKAKNINTEEIIKEINEEIDNAGDYEGKEKVKEKVKKLGDDFVKEKERLESIITQYEGQVTLGKLLGITFHETAKPTKYMRDNISNIEYLVKKLEKILIGGAGETGDELLELTRGYGINATIVSEFMLKYLEPLVKGKGKRANFNLIKTLNLAVKTLYTGIQESNISVKINSSDSFVIGGFEKDYLIAFVNFIDNSIYWLNEKGGDYQKIIVIDFKIDIENGSTKVLFMDNGLGIVNLDPSEYAQLFEPGFTRKSNGSGLGLSIAGEVLSKNDVLIRVLPKNDEYNFILELTIPSIGQDA